VEFNENTDGKVYHVDLDGTLTNGERFWREEPTPRLPVVNALIGLYKKGNIIIIWTARQWKHAPETVGWLIKHSIPFHGIYMGKGGSDAYIDDKSVSIDEFVRLGGL